MPLAVVLEHLKKTKPEGRDLTGTTTPMTGKQNERLCDCLLAACGNENDPLKTFLTHAFVVSWFDVITTNSCKKNVFDFIQALLRNPGEIPRFAHALIDHFPNSPDLHWEAFNLLIPAPFESLKGVLDNEATAATIFRLAAVKFNELRPTGSTGEAGSTHSSGEPTVAERCPKDSGDRQPPPSQPVATPPQKRRRPWGWVLCTAGICLPVGVSAGLCCIFIQPNGQPGTTPPAVASIPQPTPATSLKPGPFPNFEIVAARQQEKDAAGNPLPYDVTTRDAIDALRKDNDTVLRVLIRHLPGASVPVEVSIRPAAGNLRITTRAFRRKSEHEGPTPLDSKDDPPGRFGGVKAEPGEVIDILVGVSVPRNDKGEPDGGLAELLHKMIASDVYRSIIRVRVKPQ